MTVTKIPARPRRTLARVTTGAVLTAGTFFALALPAFAESAEDPAPALGLAKSLGLFVGIPIGAFLLIAVLVAAPGLIGRTRAEEDLGWYRDATTDAVEIDAEAPELEAAPAKS